MAEDDGENEDLGRGTLIKIHLKEGEEVRGGGTGTRGGGGGEVAALILAGCGCGVLRVCVMGLTRLFNPEPNSPRSCISLATLC